MKTFAFHSATSLAEAFALGADGAVFLAGGTELLNWMRLEIATPDQVVDISRIPGLNQIESHADGGLVIGALVRLADLASYAQVMREYPVLAQAARKAASPQIRNLATLGGNLLQATRCAYFRSDDGLPCNKRFPGSGCGAIHGLNHRHAIFGWSEQCVATQPSDLAVALAVLDAVVVVAGPSGLRRLQICDFHTLPGDTPERDNVLRPGEIITSLELPAPAPRSVYLKVCERAAFSFAIVSAAVALEIEAGVVRHARLALGSVAHKPWRLESVEEGLLGLRVGSERALALVEAAFLGASPLSQNAYKVRLARNALLRALSHCAELK